jgi:DNA-binding NtrC family response regulator
VSHDRDVEALHGRIDELERKINILIDRLGDGPSEHDVRNDPGQPLDVRLQQLEREAIVHALHAYRGNKRRAAEHLRVKRSTLYERMRRLGLPMDLGEVGADEDSPSTD